MKQIPAYCVAFLVLLLAVPVLWLAERAERAYWRKWGKLQMGMTDGYHTYVDGRCRVK